MRAPIEHRRNLPDCGGRPAAVDRRYHPTPPGGAGGASFRRGHLGRGVAQHRARRPRSTPSTSSTACCPWAPTAKSCAGSSQSRADTSSVEASSHPSACVGGLPPGIAGRAPSASTIIACWSAQSSPSVAASSGPEGASSKPVRGRREPAGQDRLEPGPIGEVHPVDLRDRAGVLCDPPDLCAVGTEGERGEHRVRLREDEPHGVFPLVVREPDALALPLVDDEAERQPARVIRDRLVRPGGQCREALDLPVVHEALQRGVRSVRVDDREPERVAPVEHARGLPLRRPGRRLRRQALHLHVREQRSVALRAEREGSRIRRPRTGTRAPPSRDRAPRRDPRRRTRPSREASPSPDIPRAVPSRLPGSCRPGASSSTAPVIRRSSAPACSSWMSTYRRSTTTTIARNAQRMRTHRRYTRRCVGRKRPSAYSAAMTSSGMSKLA